MSPSPKKKIAERCGLGCQSTTQSPGYILYQLKYFVSGLSLAEGGPETRGSEPGEMFESL